MKPRIVAIIQARMASSRLPGKVLMDVEGETMLGRVVDRTRRATTLQEVILATTIDASDDPIVAYCEKRRIICTRGSHFDVLDRYHAAAKETGADVVVRITADCPLIDPTLIDDAVETLLRTDGAGSEPYPTTETRFDLVLNRLPPPWSRTYPIGLDVEVCTFEAMERAWRETQLPVDREHVMPYLYDGLQLSPLDGHISSGTTPRGFRVALLNHEEDLGGLRWTVDTGDDLEFVREVYRHLGDRPEFSWLDILGLLRSHPELMSINAGVQHKTVRDIDERTPGVKGG